MATRNKKHVRETARKERLRDAEFAGYCAALAKHEATIALIRKTFPGWLPAFKPVF